MSARSVDVLISSPDANFRALARAVLRAQGYEVVATSVGPNQLPRQVRLRTPRVLLLDSPAVSAALRKCARSVGAKIVCVREDAADAPLGAEATVSKWAPAAQLTATVGAALAGEVRSPGLRLVEP